MSKPRKVRRDSKLKNLPAEQRELIANWLAEDGVESCLQSMRAQLGISSNRDSLYTALAFWRAEKRFGTFQTLAQAQAEMESAAKGGMTADQMQEAVDRNFIMLAAGAEDVKTYQELRYLRIADQTAKSNGKIAMKKLDQKDRSLAQKDEEIRLMQIKAAEAMLSGALRLKADEINSRDISHAEKIEAMRKAAFSEIDELQASGKVVIPT